MSSKGPQSPQEVKKMHKGYPRPSGLRFSTDPQNVLNFLKRSSKPSKSTEVHKRYSRRPQIPQKLINVLKILRSSKVPQMVIKWSSQSPQNFQKTALKRTTSSHQKFLKCSSMFWKHQVIRSSKSPQKVHKILKKSRKCTKGTQGPRSPQVLRWSSKCTPFPQKVLKALEVLRVLQKVFKTTSNSSKSYQRPQNPVVVKSSSNGHQMVLTNSSKVPKNSPKKGPQEFMKRSWKVLRSFALLKSTGLQKVLKRSTKSSKTQENAQKVPKVLAALRPQLILKISSKGQENAQKVPNVLRTGFLKWSSNYSKGSQNPRNLERSSKDTQIVLKVLKNLSTSLKSSVGNQVRKDPQCPEKSLKSSKPLSPQKVHKKSSKVPERFSNVLRASGPQVFKKPTKGPQSHQKVRKMHKRYPRSSGLRFSTDPQNILNFFQRCSKPLEVHRGPQKVFKATSNSSKSYQRPQNPVMVKSSSNGHQMVLTKSSKFPKNSPQKVHKKSSKVPQRFFNVLKASGPQVFKMSSKDPQSPQEVKKMHKRYPRSSQPSGLNWSSKYPQKVKKMHRRSPTSSGRRSSNDPQITQKVLKLLEVLRGLQKVFKTTSKSSKSYQRPQNPVIVKSSSNGHQMVLTKSSRVPKNSPKKGPQEFLKRSWKVLQSFAILRSSVLQKVLKRSTKSSKIQENAQKIPKVLAVLRFSADPQDVLNFLKRSSKPSKSTEVHKRYSRRPQIPQKFNNVLKILWSSKVPRMIIKWSSGLGSSNDPQITQKVLKILEILKGPQKILKSSSMSSKIYQRP